MGKFELWRKLMQRWLVTGGAGFIGSNFILHARKNDLAEILNYDVLTYAGNLDNLITLEDDPRYMFRRGDIKDQSFLNATINEFQPDRIINFAAESHVDRSIENPEEFLQTNVIGTFRLLEEAKKYWLRSAAANQFRFLHVSTDEVYGSLSEDQEPFTEESQYQPNSPYAASKASSDHLVRSYFHTYGVPVVTSNCSNNYGPYQYPEKLIPHMITKALAGSDLPIYGDGKNKRDWLFVEDHVEALCIVLAKGELGATYNIGGQCELTNQEVVEHICQVLDDLRPLEGGNTYKNQISYVQDRPGHDRRYGINCSKIEREFGWQARMPFEHGLKETVKWYLDQANWLQSVEKSGYSWSRLGVS